MHNRDKPVECEAVFLHTCISCDFKTNDYSNLTEHIDKSHRSAPVPTTPKPSYKCGKCEFQTESPDEQSTHKLLTSIIIIII